VPDTGLALPALAIAIVAMGLGSALQASVGMGFALLAAPILALIEPRFVPGPALLAGSALALVTAWRDRADLERRGLALSLAGYVVGTVAGAFALKGLAGPHLMKVFGVLVLVAVAISVCGLRIMPTPRAMLVGGTASGVMGTMASLSGPPIALVFQNAEPARARATLGAFFFVSYLISVTAIAAVGHFGRHELVLAAVLLPGVAIGLWLGRYLAGRVDARRLRVALLAISTLSAVSLLLR